MSAVVCIGNSNLSVTWLVGHAVLGNFLRSESHRKDTHWVTGPGDPGASASEAVTGQHRQAHAPLKGEFGKWAK